MGFFKKIKELFTSTRYPEEGTPLLGTEDLKKKIISVNRATAPFQIKDGMEEGVDFIAEWKIVDASWYQIFAKASKQDTFKIYLKIHPETNEVRALDKRFKVEWEAGIPKLSFSASAFVGQQQSVEYGTEYAFTEKGEFGNVYNYRFATSEIKKPIQDAVTSCGWIYKGVTLPTGL